VGHPASRRATEQNLRLLGGGIRPVCVGTTIWNNAGVYDIRPLPLIDGEHFHRHFDLNVLGLLLATREAVKRMNGSGSVINISSLVSAIPLANGSVYSATKAEVDAITQSLAQELGPQGIRVNSVLSGATVTEGFHAMGDVAKEFEAMSVARTPMGRMGAAKDIAGTALFLATEDAGWVTGAEIQVSGGLRP
jgi:3-oxoacyl-[acyl-carrier protein] reductase